MDIYVNRSQAVAAQEAANRNPTPVESGKPLPVSPASTPASDQAAVTAEERKQKQPPPSVELSEKTVQRLNEVLQERARELEFSVDEDSGHTIVRVIHKESGEVIRQLPPEVVLRFADAFTKGTASLVEDFA